MRTPHHLCAVAWAIAALAGAPFPATATEPDTTPPVEIPEIPQITEIPGITVAAPEPRYVAPTLRDRIGRIWAPVHINGQGPYRLVLDTGASASAITPAVAARLGIPVGESDRVMLHGVTGSAETSTIRADRLEVGELMMERPRLLIVDDAFGGAEGVLSMAGFKDTRILIEFRHDRIEIARSRNERAPAGYSTVPVQLSRGRVLTTDARVGPIRAKAVIDTGAQQTIGNLALREALHTRRRSLQEREQGVIGVTGDVQEGLNINVPPIGIGDLTISNARITFVDLSIFRHWGFIDEPVLMIGMDVLGLLDTMIIDYRRRELQLRTRRGGA